MRPLSPLLALYIAVACLGGCEEKPKCCKPDERPGCCMYYGGTKTDGVCPRTCDGMPWPNDPAWRLIEDENGCKVWTSEGSTGSRCGQLPEDAGFRADASVASDGAYD